MKRRLAALLDPPGVVCAAPGCSAVTRYPFDGRCGACSRGARVQNPDPQGGRWGWSNDRTPPCLRGVSQASHDALALPS